MLIGFDAKKAIRNHTGIGNYSRRCIRAVEQEGAQVRLFYSDVPLWGEVWRNFLQWRSIRRSHVDLYHGLSNELPYGIRKSGVKSIVTIHDLIFLRFPHTYSWLQRQILKVKTRYACRVADHIIAVSEMTKRDLEHFYGVKPERISVIYQSIDDAYRHQVPPSELSNIQARYNLPSRFLLCVGTIQQRKNQAVLVRALPMLPEDVHLVLVGRGEQPYASQVEEEARTLGVTSRLHILTGVPSDHLPAIYQLASVFACLSRFEGFGIPLAEALASGLPVIGATGSCLEEAGGPDSIYLDPDDAAGLAQHVMELLSSPEQRAQMATKGKAYALRFTDEELGKQLLSIYQKLLTTTSV